MADIFISYARADRDRIEKLAAALEAQGYSVWWDRHIVGGAEFSEEIERALDAAAIVIVAWSADAAKSPWVKDEAVAARDAGKLIPITFDETPAPMGFRQFQAIDCQSWKGDAAAAPFQDLSRAVKARLTGEHQTAPAMSEKASW
ncbi:MAG: toll/interleukin-1 receptor domain-containing protein, partial [Alphaproteobacteria bacterium]|nr:toll/interleukin-1 receptor domain-containing protein [Alphaproteobacteria bacterium]